MLVIEIIRYNMSFDYIKIKKENLSFDLVKRMKVNFEEINSEDLILYYESIKDVASYKKSSLKELNKVEERDFYSMGNKEYFPIKKFLEDIFDRHLYKVIVPLINYKTMPELPTNLVAIDEEGFILIISLKSGIYSNREEYCFINMINRFNLLEEL